MAKPANDPRPLSPHLQVWRWHPTMASSIFHRMTGVGNYIGAAFVAVWLAVVALGPEAYATFDPVISSWFGRLVMIAFTLSVTYHLANGVRHLVWDAGAGYEPGVANAVSVFNIVFAILATAAIWGAAVMLATSA